MDVQIVGLRKKLGSAGEYIETVRVIGDSEESPDKIENHADRPESVLGEGSAFTLHLPKEKASG